MENRLHIIGDGPDFTTNSVVILYHRRQGVSVLGTRGGRVLYARICGSDASRTSSLEPTRQSRRRRGAARIPADSEKAREMSGFSFSSRRGREFIRNPTYFLVVD